MGRLRREIVDPPGQGQLETLHCDRAHRRLSGDAFRVDGRYSVRIPRPPGGIVTAPKVAPLELQASRS